MPDEERVRTKRRKLDSIITKLHHATPPGRENLEEETKPDEAAQENVNADEGKETRPRLSRRKLHVAVKQKEVSDVLNVEALPEDKAQEQLSDNGVMEDEAWANSTKEDAENLICNGERDTDEKIEPECSTKGKTGPLESVDNTEDGFQKGLSEEAEKEDTQGGEIKRKRLHSEGSEADGGELPRRVDCTACGRQINPAHGTICQHPCLNVLVCKKCNQYYNSGPFTRDELGIDEQCRWCGDGGSLLCCDKCDKAFCKPCIKRNLGKITLREIVSAPEGVEWLCFSCNPKPLSKLIRACNRIMKIVQTRKAQKTIFKTKKGPLLTDTPNQKERRNRLSSLTENLGMNSDGALSPSESQTKKNVAGTSEDDSDFVQNKTEEAKYRKQNGSLKDVITIQDESDSDDIVNSDKVSEKKTAKGKANLGTKRNMEKTVKKRDYNSRPQRSKQNDKKVKNRIDSDICLDKRKSKVKSANKKGKNKMLSVKTSKGGQGSGSESDLSDFISMVNTTNRQAKKHGGRQRKDKAQGYLISSSEEEDEESSVDEDEESSEDEDVDSEKDKRTRRSRKSSVSQKQTRKRRRKVTSSENDSEFSENQSGSHTPDKKGKQSQKRRRKEKVALESDEEDDSDDDDKEIGSKNKRKLSRKSKKSDSESEKDKKNVNKKGKGKTKGKKKGGKKKKKHYIEKDSGESEEVDEEEEVSPSKRKGRKKIRKLIKDEKLTEETKRARKLEEERRKRLLERTRNNEDDMPGETAKVHKLVLESDPTTKESIVEVKEDLLQYLKPHQCRGIQFMYDCVIESVNSWKKDEPGGGCILAHCMGLGKTLQVVGLVHTLMTHKEINMQRVMVVSPLNTVLNWQVEFDKWLSVDDRLEVLILQDVSGDNWRRADMLNHWFKYGGVLILGYSMYRNLSQCFRVRSKNQKKIFQEALVNPGPDLVICDEGHILRNDATAISKALNGIKTRRRIVLTGTPLQNNLIEYHCMVSFVKPSLLGTRKEYTNTFVNPIQNGQCADSTAMDVQLMKQRCHVLHKMLEGCVQRMDYSVLIPFLPRKHEYVIKVRLSILQRTLYHHFLSTFVYPEGTLGKKGVSLFSDYQALMRIWTHPWCLKLEALRRPEKFIDSDSMDDFVVHTDEEEEDQENEDEEQMEWESSSEEEVQFSSESDEDSKRKQRRRRRGKESSSDEEEDEEEEEEVEDESDGDSEDEEVVPQPSKSSKRTNASTVNIDGEEITVVNINNRAGTSGRKLRDKDPQSGKRDTEERKGKATTKSESKGSSNSGSDSALCSSSAFGSTRSGTAFKDVEDVEIEDEKEWYDEFLTEADELNEQLSGKLVLLMEILADAEAVEDKVLVFSQSLVTLDLIEKMLGGGEIGGDRENWCRGCDYFRMDGSTSAAMRQRWADIFNDEDNKNARLFLISTKAGGLGINLVAANRVIVFDVSWNPSHDVQSIFRVYRFGQSKPVFVYRFIAQGTMEEKIYDRQVTKLAISGRVVDEQQIERHFNAADLSELYTFNPELLEEDKVAAAGKNQQDAMDTEAENGNEAISGRGIGKDEKSEKESRNVEESVGAEKCEISAGNSGTSNQTGTETKTPEAPKMPLPKDAVLADLINRLHPKWIVNYHEHDSLLQNIESEKLTEDEMKAAWEAYEAEKSGKTVSGPVQDSLMPDHAQTQQHVAERIRLNSEMLQQIQQIRQLQEMQQRQEVEERMRRVRQQREQIYQRQREVLIQEHRRQQDEMRRHNQMRFIHHMTQPGATPQLQLGQNTINVQTQLPNVAAPRHAPPPPYLSIQVPTAVPIGLRLPSSVGPPLPVTPPAASNPTNR
ncbi:transcriptional regulator ATRX homolog [Montipora capricornis]|uniref:transcriptional regulator ATRX homolog n=1 Tax=Montipora capricornis TaxID=246305 RepID=UPI0035F1BC27